MKDSKKTSDPANSRSAKKPKQGQRGKRGNVRDAIVQRLWKAAERQVSDIEKRLMLAKQEPAERERDTRMMAVLVKTLCELSALDGAKPQKPGAKSARSSTPTAPEQNDDSSDDIPRDIEEFRRELARRIAGLAAEAATETDSGI